MPETISTEPPRHQSGGLAVALAKLDLDAITVADAVADVASMAGENVTTAIRADFKGASPAPEDWEWARRRPSRGRRRH